MSAKISAQFHLRRPLSGRCIRDAVQNVSLDNFFEELAIVNDNGEYYDIGRKSEMPYEDNQVIVEGKYIRMENNYTKITIRYKHRPGLKFAIGYSNNDIVKAVRNFRDELKKILDQYK